MVLNGSQDLTIKQDDEVSFLGRSVPVQVVPGAHLPVGCRGPP